MTGIAILGGGWLHLAGAAGANNFSGATGATGCASANMQDPNPHTMFFSDLEAATADAVEWARLNVIEPTSVDTSRLTSVNSLTDVVAYDQDYTTYCGLLWDGSGGKVVGLATCVSLASGGRCEKHEVRFDLSFLHRATVADQRGLAAHELGHTLGLLHRDDEPGAMQTEGPYPTTFTAHDVAHVNGAPDRLFAGQSLVPGTRLLSWDGRYSLWMQTDGNLVVYFNPTGAATWSSGTAPNSGARAVMQQDGNFVVYTPGGAALCSTRTWSHPGAWIGMQRDGNLVVYSATSSPLWATNSGGTCT